MTGSADDTADYDEQWHLDSWPQLTHWGRDGKDDFDSRSAAISTDALAVEGPPVI